MLNDRRPGLVCRSEGRLLPLLLALAALLAMPLAGRAEMAPGYEDYREGHVGYLGDGIIEKGKNSTAELARAVQNPIADLISVPFQNNMNFNFGPREKHKTS